MSGINFESKLVEINGWTLVVLPETASKKLPSRGMVLVRGTLNGADFLTPLEPDGRGSHWLKVDEAMREAAGAKVGDTVKLTIEPSKDWPEPPLPADVKQALAGDSRAQSLWADVTPMARWDWLRWINSTAKSETRKKRIEVAFSKLKNGTRRPCCFNRALCTVPEVSKGGALLA